MRAILTQIRGGLLEDRAILIGVGAIWLFLVALLAHKGVPPPSARANASNFLIYLIAAFLFFGLPAGAIGLYRDRPESPIRYLRGLATASPGALGAWRGVPMLLALMFFMPAFSAMKSAIPLFNDYAWDSTWIAADRAIFGMDAWRRLQPALGHPSITAALALLYHLWILLIYAGGVYFAMFARDRVLRRQYLIAFFGIWIVIGVAMATYFASVGPCFAWPILRNPAFLEQMQYLKAANQRYPVLVLEVQDALLADYRSGSRGLGRGITAMPSMHVALAFVFFLGMRRISSKLALASGLFCLIIVIGSIHLGYHYAIDDIVAAASALVIWRIAGLLAKSSGSSRSTDALGSAVSL